MNPPDATPPVPCECRRWVSSASCAALAFLVACGQPEPEEARTTPGDEKGVPGSPVEEDPGNELTAAQRAKLDQSLSARLTFGTAEEVAALLAQGASPNSENRYGLPAIFTAAERGEVPILEALVNAGADVNATMGTSFNTDGVGYSGTVDGTPLSYAAAKGKVEAMGFLVQQGADVNGAGPDGTTALMRAAEGLQLEAVRWLLENGSTAGKAEALKLAQQFFNPDEKTREIIQLLQ